MVHTTLPPALGEHPLEPADPDRPGQAGHLSHPAGPSGATREAGLLEPHPPTGARHHALAIATYLAGSLVLWAHVWFGGDPAHAITCNCGDTVQQVWWMEWFPWALSHGHNLLFTNTLWARLGGVNAMSNTSWLAPSALLSPVTVLFGPVVSYNVANLLAPVLSGWALFTLAGRFSHRTGARIVAGGLYAFSPYVLRNTVIGHVGLTMTAYLPLVLLLGLQLLSRSARPVRVGVWLGVLTVLEFFTGLEVMAITAVTGVLCALGVLISRPALLAAARRRILTAASVAFPIAVLVLAYPLWYYLDGPRHVAGPYWKVAPSKLSMIVSAGPDVFNSHTGLTFVGYLGAQGPDTDFLGFGLLLALAVSFPWWYRRRGCLILAATGVAAWLLEAIPARWLSRVPLLSSIEPARFALPVSLCVALLLAASIDGWLGAIGRRWPANGETRVTRDTNNTWRRRAAQAGVVAAVGLAFVPLVGTYSVPFRVTTDTVPTWYQKDAPRLPAGTAVLAVPFSYGIASSPMAWQAETGDRFDLIGGWAFVPGANGVDDEMVSPLRGAVGALRALGIHPHRVSATAQADIRAAIVRWRPLVVVVVRADAPRGTATALTDTLGFAPTLTDGAWVWQLGPNSRLGPVVALP